MPVAPNDRARVSCKGDRDSRARVSSANRCYNIWKGNRKTGEGRQTLRLRRRQRRQSTRKKSLRFSLLCAAAAAAAKQPHVSGLLRCPMLHSLHVSSRSSVGRSVGHPLPFVRRLGWSWTRWRGMDSGRTEIRIRLRSIRRKTLSTFLYDRCRTTEDDDARKCKMQMQETETIFFTRCLQSASMMFFLNPCWGAFPQPT